MCSGPDTSGATAVQKCPYFPNHLATAHVETFTSSASQAIFAGIVRHPAVCAQTEAGYRSSHDRSKQKRGPPSFFLS